MSFSVFGWNSRGGSQRRDLMEAQRQKALDAVQADLARVAQETADQADRNVADFDRVEQSMGNRGEKSAFAFAAKVARQKQHNAWEPGRQVARAFEPEPNLFQRQESIFRARAGTPEAANAAIDRDRLERGGQAATAFRDRFDTGREAAGLKSFAQTAERNAEWLQERNPGMTPAEALRAELNKNKDNYESSRLRSGIESGIGPALNEVYPNDLGDRIFNKGVELATQSVLPERVTEPISHIPVVGETAEDVLRQNSSLLALGALAFPPLRAGVIASAVGQTVGGVAGEQAVKAGAPGWVDPALEFGGAVLGPGVIPGIKRLPGVSSFASKLLQNKTLPAAQKARLLEEALHPNEKPFTYREPVGRALGESLGPPSPVAAAADDIPPIRPQAAEDAGLTAAEGRVASQAETLPVAPALADDALGAAPLPAGARTPLAEPRISDVSDLDSAVNHYRTVRDNFEGLDAEDLGAYGETPATAQARLAELKQNVEARLAKIKPFEDRHPLYREHVYEAEAELGLRPFSDMERHAWARPENLAKTDARLRAQQSSLGMEPTGIGDDISRMGPEPAPALADDALGAAPAAATPAGHSPIRSTLNEVPFKGGEAEGLQRSQYRVVLTELQKGYHLDRNAAYLTDLGQRLGFTPEQIQRDISAATGGAMPPPVADAAASVTRFTDDAELVTDPQLLGNTEKQVDLLGPPSQTGESLSIESTPGGMFKPKPAAPASAPAPALAAPKLPNDLRGAKPRWKRYTPQFDSDVDKALYIVAQTTRSKADARYMDWLREVLPGMADQDIRAAGKQVRKDVGAAIGRDPGVMEPVVRDLGNLRRARAIPEPPTPAPSAVAEPEVAPRRQTDLSRHLTDIDNEMAEIEARLAANKNRKPRTKALISTTEKTALNLRLANLRADAAVIENLTTDSAPLMARELQDARVELYQAIELRLATQEAMISEKGAQIAHRELNPNEVIEPVYNVAQRQRADAVHAYNQENPVAGLRAELEAHGRVLERTGLAQSNADDLFRGEGALIPGDFEDLPFEAQDALDAESFAGLGADEIDADIFGGVSVGAAKANLPTSRAVLAGSARNSIEERRVVAQETLDAMSPDHRPRSVDDYARDYGDEFVGSVFDPFFSAQRRWAGKNPTLIRNVRKVNVTRDIYSHNEGAALRGDIFHWIARTRSLLGTELDKGKMTLVQVRQGAKIPAKWRQNPAHIALHPEDYIFTPEQQKAWDELQQIQKQMILNEQAHNLDVVPLEGPYYWPMPVVKAPPGQSASVYMPLSRENMTVSPWFTKPRTDVDPFTAVGFTYANPFEALFMRADSSVDAIGNRWAIDKLKAMGYKPQVGANLTDALKAAGATYREARALALKVEREAAAALSNKPASLAQSRLLPRQPIEMQDALVAKDALDAAKVAVRRQSELVKNEGPRLFGQIVKPEIAEEFTRYIAKSDPNLWEDTWRVYRTLLVNGDYGSPMLQNYALITNAPGAWLRSFGMGASAFFKEPLAYWAKQDSVLLKKAIRVGLVSGPGEMLLSEGGRFSQQVGKLPFLKQSQRAFSHNVRIGQWERAKGIMAVVEDEKTLREIASVTQKQGGILFSPGTTAAKVKLMSNLWFAPQWTAAINAMLVDPLVKRGPAQALAAKSVARMIGGATAFTVAAHAALNDGDLPNMLDPNAEGFWGVRLPGGSFVYPLGPLQPTIKLLAQQAEGVANVAQGESYGLENAFGPAKFIESKLGIGPRWITAAIEAMGAPLENVRGSAYGQPDKKLDFSEMFSKARKGDVLGVLSQGSKQGVIPLPIGVSQGIEGVRRGQPAGALEALGVRTTLPPTSGSKAYKLRQELEKLPAYDGLSNEDAEAIADFRAQVTKDRNAYMDENPGEDAGDLSEWIAGNASAMLDDPLLVGWATASGRQLDAARSTSERTKFILANWDAIDAAYPQLTKARWLRDLHAAQQ